MPVHTLITPAGPNLAALTYAAFGVRPDGGVEITLRGPAWDTTAATGVKAARWPTPARLQLLLEPEPQLQASSIPDRITRAYQGAFRVGFDDKSRNISDQELLAAVSRRRSGRPLGIAA